MPINKIQLGIDLVNALTPIFVGGSQAINNYEATRAKLLADYVNEIEKQFKDQQIDADDVENFVREQKDLEEQALRTAGFLKAVVRAQAVTAVLKVFQGAINTATGLAISVV